MDLAGALSQEVKGGGVKLELDDDRNIVHRYVHAVCKQCTRVVFKEFV